MTGAVPVELRTSDSVFMKTVMLPLVSTLLKRVRDNRTHIETGAVPVMRGTPVPVFMGAVRLFLSGSSQQVTRKGNRVI